MTTALTITPSIDLLPAQLFAPTPKTAKRFVEFFTAQINNDHTRKAYLNATRRFAGWCQAHDLAELADVQPFHVAAFVKEMQGQFTCGRARLRARSSFSWRMGMAAPKIARYRRREKTS